jgi:hypothetical protein
MVKSGMGPYCRQYHPLLFFSNCQLAQQDVAGDDQTHLGVARTQIFCLIIHTSGMLQIVSNYTPKAYITHYPNFVFGHHPSFIFFSKRWIGPRADPKKKKKRRRRKKQMVLFQ